MDPTGCEILLNEGVELFLLIVHERVDFTVFWGRPGHQLDGMIPHLALRECIKGVLGEDLLGDTWEF